MDQYTWNILFIDVDEENYLTTHQMLSEILDENYSLKWADSFEAGQEALAQKRYDAVLVGNYLGPRSGIEWIRDATAKAYCAPLLLLSRQWDRALDLEAMEAGAAGYLCKEEMTPASLECALRYAIEHKKRELQLRENQVDYAHAQSISRAGNWRLNINQNEFICSEETYRIFEVPPGTPMRFECFLKIIHPEDRDFVERSWSAALQGAPYDIEHRIHVRNQVKWVHVKAVLEFDERCELKGRFGIIEDITKRKRSEQALRESLNQAAWVARISDENPQPIARVTLDGRLLYQNRAARQLPGWQCEFGERVDEWLLVLIRKTQQEGEIEQDLQLSGRCYSVCAVPFPEEGYIDLFGREVTAPRRTDNEKSIREVTKRIQ